MTKVLRSTLPWGQVGFQSVRRVPKTRSKCCQILALATIIITLGACGLSQREKQIAATNSQIIQVGQESEALAAAIYDTPDVPEGPESFAGVLTAYRSYRAEVDRLNVQLHRLGEVVPALTPHLGEEFDPNVESALAHCDTAVAVLESPADDTTYRSALTSMGLCIEEYAAAVTAVSRQYSGLDS